MILLAFFGALNAHNQHNIIYLRRSRYVQTGINRHIFWHNAWGAPSPQNFKWWTYDLEKKWFFHLRLLLFFFIGKSITMKWTKKKNSSWENSLYVCLRFYFKGKKGQCYRSLALITENIFFRRFANDVLRYFRSFRFIHFICRTILNMSPRVIYVQKWILFIFSSSYLFVRLWNLCLERHTKWMCEQFFFFSAFERCSNANNK